MTKLYTIVLILLAYYSSSSSFLVSGQVDSCKDTDWVDEDGCGCEEYEYNREWCGLYGEFFYEGSSANEACCACGGGNTVTIGDDTDPPIVIGQKNCILSPPIEVAPGLTVENWIDNDELQFRMRLTYKGTSWIGLSFENDGLPGKPTFAVIGRQENENQASVKKYILNTANPDASGVVEMSQGSQTLEDVSFVQTNGKTIMSFIKPLNEIFDNPTQIVTDRSTWIYAVGLPNNAWQGTHTIHGKFNLALTPCFTNPWEIANPSVNGGLVDGNNLSGRSFLGEKPNKFLWIAHGISLGLAWGIVAPLGFASLFLKRKGPKWSKIHQFCNTTTLLMTCSGILLGVIATYMEEDAAHLRSEHSYWGVGVFGGFLVYCLMALYFGASQQKKEKPKVRVAPPAPKSPDLILGMGDGLEVLSGDSPHNPRRHSPYYSDPYEDYLPPQSDEPGCLEWLSRLLLLACIGVAYYTCHTGLEWQLFHFDLDWKYYYWGAGAAGVLILCLLVPLSCCLSDANEPPKSKSVSLGAQDSMVGSSVDRRTPHSDDDQAYFGRDDDYLADASTEDGTLQYVEDFDAQRSPIRKSWDLSDNCCL